MLTSQHTLILNLPIDRVMHIFKNQDYFKYWQKNLISFQNTSSSIGLVGSTRSMVLKIAGSRITMTEQITAVDLPHRWEAVYRTNGVVNTQKNTFTTLPPDAGGRERTQWTAHVTFTFTGMMRLVSKAKPALFTEQTKQLMADFKTFAESLPDA